MLTERRTDTALKVCTAALIAVSLLLTFTVSDYYIFNRIGEFNFFFVFAQWVKKAGLLLLALAVFYKKRSCSDVAKYVLPAFVIISACSFGGFFDVTMLTENASPAQKVFASLNEFITKPANMALFFISCILYLAVCALLFVRDGYKAEAASLKFLPLALLAVMPLNIFENFFNIDNFSPDHFLLFKNFTLWHFLAVCALAGFTIGAYYFLRKLPGQKQKDYLAAAAIVLLIQYHSKDSVVMGDGYNVYYTAFACIPLFICNIGVYVASLAVIARKRVLYAISFFVHAAGALTVFFYFGKDEMSDYGIFVSYSILYFCLTHCLLFALCVLPSALGHYKFAVKDCVIPLVYYCAVIIAAAIASGIVTSFLTSYSYDGYTLTVGEGAGFDMAPPNYAFTQVNPLPIPVIDVPVTIWKCKLNLFYLFCLYIVYVGLFWAFTGGYYAFLKIRARVLAGKTPVPEPALSPAEAEAAITDDEKDV